MEKQFIDLSIINMLLKEKSTVKGSFEEGIYIKERKVEFEKIPVCCGQIYVYLPKKRLHKEIYGKEFVCPDDMELYEEFVCEEGKYGIAFETCKLMGKQEIEISGEELAESFIEEIEEKYEDTCVYITDIFRGKRILCCLMAEGEIRDNTVFAYIYFIKNEKSLFRCYIFCEKSNWKEISYLAAKIVDNIEVK